MGLVHVDRNPKPRQLAVFAVLWVAAYALLGRLLWSWTGSPWAAAGAWAVAVAVPAAGALRPVVLRVAFVALAVATAPLGWAVSFAILAALYFLVVTPMGLLLRLFGHDPLARRFEPGAGSYFTERPQEDRPERYFRQF